MSTEQVICPVCNAATARGQNCWLCHSEVAATAAPASADETQAPVVATLVNPYEAPVPIEEASSSTFPIIALIIGLVIVIVALGFAAPGLGGLIAIFVAPALIRTAILVGRKQKAGAVVSTGEKSVIFLASAAGVVAACATAVSAFLIACTASCFGLMAAGSAGSGKDVDEWIPILLAGSAIVGLVAGGFLLWVLWRRKR